MAAGGRVLLVEDEGLVRMTLAEALAGAGFEVVQADSGDAAWPLIGAHEAIDLVVTDMQMPGSRDGAAVASAVRRVHPRVAVIYMTGRPEILERLGRLGAREATLSKPFDLADMLGTARRLLAAA